MNQLELQGLLRNTWGRWDHKSIEAILPANDQCEYQPKFYSAPGRASQVVAAGEYASGQVTIPAGSFIYALSHLDPAARFRLQITDLSLGHQLFNIPIENESIDARPWYLPELYPVVAPGIFRCEFWNTLATSGRVQIILCVAEVRG